MYEQVDNADAMSEINAGEEMHVVDIKTSRVISCASMTISAIKSFVERDDVMFFKTVS